MTSFDLSMHGITVKTILRNVAPSKLYEEAIRFEPGTTISDTGALIAYSGEKTGRSPQDKRLVRHATSEEDIWWGPVNFPLDQVSFSINRERAKDYLNTRDRLYVVDGYAGWDPQYQIKVRIICSRPYHALFMHQMLIRPTDEQLKNYGDPDFVVYNAGSFPANRFTTGMTSKTSVDVSFENGEVVILGTEYAGEMKKGIFTIMNYLMPKRNVLSMHCSATADRQTGQSSILFGLSGTGKTTLSADPKRSLIGDDEHCWSPEGIFNIEGGCYAKAIYLSRESEPEIFQALRFGAVLENVIYDDAHHHVDFDNSIITQNTRGAYPIEYVTNARIPCTAGHPTDVIFLTCDAFGVLPPVSRLTSEQAIYHFINGYTAKIAGTEVGIKEPQATFSPCFGGPFLVWHPRKYAELLAEKIEKHKANVWLVNTGWSGGPYGVGSRMKLHHTRAIVDAIHAGQLQNAPTQVDPIFGLQVITQCPEVPDAVLNPRQTWSDPAAYDDTARKLARLFEETTSSSKKGAPSKERWTDEGSIQLKPPVNWQIRIPILIVLLLPVFIAPGLSGIGRVLACVMPLMLCGTFRITRISDGWLRSRLFMGFVPVLTQKCKLAAVVYIGTKYGGSEPGVGTFVLFGPIQYFFGYIFDFLIPAMGGPYELWLETAKGREFIVWQGFNQECFEKNLELLRNQTGPRLRRSEEVAAISEEPQSALEI